ncbi:MAG TPA: hypothetical protein VGK35_00620 [Actinotalea sp.]|jgi:hypothetical protein
MGFTTLIPTDAATYLTWGWVSVSVPNLIAILVTLALLVLAVLLPFPTDRDHSEDDS